MRTIFSFLITAALLLISQYGMGQPRAVDLGLSVKWASCNLGANVPEEYGDYYAWGETVSKTNYILSNYYLWIQYYGFTRYNTRRSCGPVDNKIVLDPRDDAAHKKLGGNWRMPTAAEWDELIDSCAWVWTTQNGVNGYLVCGPTFNVIFLPAAGMMYRMDLYNTGGYDGGLYWSSSLYTDNPDRAYYVYFGSGGVDRGYNDRYLGFSVRPVSE